MGNGLVGKKIRSIYFENSGPLVEKEKREKKDADIRVWTDLDTDARNSFDVCGLQVYYVQPTCIDRTIPDISSSKLVHGLRGNIGT